MPSIETPHKIVFIGNDGVGKTQLVQRITDKAFQKEYEPTIGASFAVRRLVRSTGDCIKLEIWDTAGQERYRSLTHWYLKSVSAVVLIFDLSNQASFDNLSTWLELLSKNPLLNAPIILVGNKSDLVDERVVSSAQAQAFFEDTNTLSYYGETSARTNQNIDSINTEGSLLHAIASLTMPTANTSIDKKGKTPDTKPYYPPKSNQHYINRYKKIWSKDHTYFNQDGLEKHRRPLIHLLDNYARGNKTWRLWCGFHANRNRENTKEAHKIARAMERTDTPISVEDAYQQLAELRMKENGSLHRRIDFIQSTLYPAPTTGLQISNPTLISVKKRYLPVLA